MREIKFRAWDKIESRMIYDIIPIPLYNTILEFYDDRAWDELVGDFEIMQYTGFKDKNNREIYEGDIIIEDKYKDLGGGYVVEWDKYSGAWICRNDVGLYFLYDLLISDKMIIIGNIYENTELLEN